MEHIIYDDAAWIPGWKQPFIRSAFWRWIRWPEDFNVKLATESGEYFISWIDEDMKKETLEAMKSGKTFEPQVLVFDQYKEEL
jgi:microcin C transport system substrate-binding protein